MHQRKLMAAFAFAAFALASFTAGAATKIVAVADTDVLTEGKPLASLGFSAGIGTEFYRESYIESARLVGDQQLVVVEDEFRSRPSLWAVGTWTPDTCGNSKKVNFWCDNIARPGFYIGTNVVGNGGDALDAFSLGFQLTFMERVLARDPSQKTKKVLQPSWVVGIGWVNHSTRRFANGIREDQPLPEDFSEVVYRNGRENSWVIMVTKVLGTVNK